MKPHRMDGVSLTFGLIFLGVAFWWAISRVITVHLPAVGWIVAAALIVFGVIGLLGAIRSGRRDEPAPVVAEARIETPGDLPPEMHASIVQELLDDPAHRFADEHPKSSDDRPRQG
ncbi:phage holin family protein [Actinoplanes sp. DH11]|uniref:phage holin family protein n=1 Tax=Actinoplanes sp. DH11 TaxID=2857011 RepID=UPI001E297F24|nr:phage holin family protein [Actinoplanes sp. DH11]